MAILGRFTKQPGETIDYPVDFTEWFEGRTGDSIASYTVTTEPGISIATQNKTGFVIAVVLAGGTSGISYKTTIRVTTAAGLVKEAEFVVKVKET